MSAPAPFWHWAIGGAWLAGVGVVYWQLSGHLMGTSGSLSRLVTWRQERENQAVEEAIADDEAAFEAAMLAAALEELKAQGLDVPEDLVAPSPLDTPGQGHELPSFCGTPQRLPVECHLLFLLCLIAGGALAAVTSGRFAWSTSLGPTHQRFFGEGARLVATLLGGGFLVGFGTAMAGGCTSGHGLNGCARLQPGSLASTAAFFGTAVAVSLALESWIV